jgi:hypothetical protein
MAPTSFPSEEQILTQILRYLVKDLPGVMPEAPPSQAGNFQGISPQYNDVTRSRVKHWGFRMGYRIWLPNDPDNLIIDSPGGNIGDYVGPIAVPAINEKLVGLPNFKKQNGIYVAEIPRYSLIHKLGERLDLLQ